MVNSSGGGIQRSVPSGMRRFSISLLKGYYRKVGFRWEKETFEQAGTEFIVEYEKRKRECRLQIGAKNLLEKVEKAGLSQAVLSAYSHGSLEEFLKHFGVRGYFRTIAGSRDHYAAG